MIVDRKRRRLMVGRAAPKSIVFPLVTGGAAIQDLAVTHRQEKPLGA